MRKSIKSCCIAAANLACTYAWAIADYQPALQVQAALIWISLPVFAIHYFSGEAGRLAKSPGRHMAIELLHQFQVVAMLAALAAHGHLMTCAALAATKLLQSAITRT